MISIDLGNKNTAISDGVDCLELPTTILFQKNQLCKVGVPTEMQGAVYDFIRVLGLKYNDPDFSESMKFYPHDFQKTQTNKIQIVIPPYPHIKHRKLTAQCLSALYLRGIIDMFNEIYYPKLKVRESHRFYLIISNGMKHPYRYALKQVCQIAGIQNPLFVPSIHAAVSTLYLKQSLQTQNSRTLLTFEISDRSTVFAVYRLHHWEQKIIETLKMKRMSLGGVHFTQILGQFILKSMKIEKGIDIQKYGYYMNIVNQQSERCKVSLTEQEQYFIRVPNLPDQSNYGKIITQNLLGSFYQDSIGLIISAYRQILAEYPQISEILLVGGATQMKQFKSQFTQNTSGEMILKQCTKKQATQGLVKSHQEEITLFDITLGEYKVTGQQNFTYTFLNVGQDAPIRKSIEAKFPAGELEFNLRVFENNEKICHFLLESRPKEPVFKLFFELDRNGIVELYVTTNSGKINLIGNYEAITDNGILKQMAISNDYIISKTKQ